MGRDAPGDPSFASGHAAIDRQSAHSFCPLGLEALGFEERKGIAMDEPHFTLGVTARCSDGECGAVIRVVIDPVARKLTISSSSPGTD